MIILEGGFVFDITVGKYSDFLQYDDLIEYTLIEDAGCVLPTFDLIFRFSNPDIKNYLIENNPLTVTLGANKDTTSNIALSIFKKDIQPIGQGRYQAEISGYLNVLPFVRGTRVTALRGTAYNCIKQVVSNYFTFVSNIQTDDSEQTWLCCRKREIDFVTDMWYHSNIPNSFASVAITKDNKFLFMDMSQLIAQAPQWVFSNALNATLSNEILISGNPEVTNDTTLVNTITQSKTNIIYDMDTGERSEHTLTRLPALSNNSRAEGTDIERKDAAPLMQNSNVHANYWKSYLDNTGLLTYLSGARTVVSYINRYLPNMQVLDTAEFLHNSYNDRQSTEALYSGKYIISKIVRTIGQTKNLQTHVVLSRESFNDIKDYSIEQEQGVFEVSQNQDYSEGLNRLNSIISLVQRLLALRGIKLNFPNIRILADILADVFKGFFGVDLTGVWLKLESLLKNTLGSLLYNILRQIYQYLVSRGEARLFDADGDIMLDLLSGNYSQYINANGILTIPNVGSISIEVEDLTKGIFAWYVDGTLTGTPITDIVNYNNVDSIDIPSNYLQNTNVDTGDPELNSLLLRFIDFMRNEALTPVQETTVFRRYWGYFDDITINESQLKQLYTDLANRRFLKKTLIGKGFIYFSYPVSLGLPSIYINGNLYSNIETITKRILTNGNYENYYIIRTIDRFTSKVTLELT